MVREPYRYSPPEQLAWCPHDYLAKARILVAVLFLTRFYAGKDFLPATTNPEFSKNRFALSGSAPVARFGPPIEDRHRQTVETVCQRRYGTGVQLGFQGC